MKELKIWPKGWPCTLEECPPGFFLFRDSLCLKSEYHTTTQSGESNADAYCESGEYFWGGVSATKDRNALIVQPVEAIWQEIQQ